MRRVKRKVLAVGGWRLGIQFSGLGSRPSGIRYGLSGSGTGAGPEPEPGTEHLNPGPDGRDPRPENASPPPAIRGCHPPPETCIHFCTFAQAAGRFALLHLGQHVVLSHPQNSPNPNCSPKARQSFTGRRPLDGVGSARQAAAQQTASLRRSCISRPSCSP